MCSFVTGVQTCALPISCRKRPGSRILGPEIGQESKPQHYGNESEDHPISDFRHRPFARRKYIHDQPRRDRQEGATQDLREIDRRHAAPREPVRKQAPPMRHADEAVGGHDTEQITYELRAGTAWVGTCRSWLSPPHSKKK